MPTLTAAFGWLGALLLVAAFWCPDERWLGGLLVGGLSLMAAHLMGLGAFTAGAGCLVGAARCLATLRWPGSIWVAVIASVATVLVAIPSWGGLSSGLALAASLGSVGVMATLRGRTMRCGMLPVNVIWIAHDILVGSMPALATELACMAGNLWMLAPWSRQRPAIAAA